MNCAQPGCYSFVGRDGLNGFCAEHKIEAVMHGVLVLEHQLQEQGKLLAALQNEIRALRQGR